MPLPDEPNAEANSLDRRIAAAEAAQARKASGDSHRAMAQGYRFLGEVVGGVFMGAALGWLADRFITPEPLGLVFGLFLGAGLSIFVAVRTAARTQKRDAAKAGPLPSVPDEDED
ncbi:MAG: AtpZ/AtpI family protein [Phenylobacterium sp.]|uniref:AtpZ/AtpI family protein n=1 Tax=Phenylobacterium sp. TaxID=1871053 RepID=UPI001A548913|nr:AtpZ/AtpI family protein [Phenylobacterium sp.]MBL8773873.1 AtpZ/AtpI family protein [Phenylobacterium sp.]